MHTIYQAMNLSFADRDFYYGDTYFAPNEPIKGLLSKEYAKQRAAQSISTGITQKQLRVIPTHSRADQIHISSAQSKIKRQ